MCLAHLNPSSRNKIILSLERVGEFSAGLASVATLAARMRDNSLEIFIAFVLIMVLYSPRSHSSLGDLVKALWRSLQVGVELIPMT